MQKQNVTLIVDPFLKNNIAVMRNILRISAVIVFINLIYSCKKEEVPVLTTSAVSGIAGRTAISGGTITSEGSGTVISRGVCWSTGTTPTIGDSKTADGAGAGNYTSNITGLDGATVYYVRAYATNDAGTGYGMAMSFTTLGQTPTPTTSVATNINATSATLNGIVNANYLSTIVTFEYGTTTSYGSTATPSQSPINGNSSSSVSADITGLTAGTSYHFRLKASNTLGTTYSPDMTFVTLGQPPTATVADATNLSGTSATLNGSVNANYLSSVISFEYGTTTSYGNTVTANPSPFSGNLNISVSASISGLLPSTTYHFRTKATNSLGTSYSADMTFMTFNWILGSMTDIDGNIYGTIQIGTQVWMKENLKTTKYRNGDIIVTTTPSTSDITGENTPKYQWAYEGNESNVNTYGKLYTWFAATDTRNLCPTGWHLPSNNEWTTLQDYLIINGYNYDGTTSENKIAKALASNSLWLPINYIGTPGNSDYPIKRNISGFTALPSGVRNPSGLFGNLISYDSWWSSSEDPSFQSFANYQQIVFSEVYSRLGGHVKSFGRSVRCLKDY